VILKVKKKPVIVEACQFTGSNHEEIKEFVGYQHFWHRQDKVEIYNKMESIYIPLKVDSYVIKGLNGECYPCNEDLFKRSYEVLDEINPGDSLR
jgi:hypothetical protein